MHIFFIVSRSQRVPRLIIQTVPDLSSKLFVHTYHPDCSVLDGQRVAPGRRRRPGPAACTRSAGAMIHRFIGSNCWCLRLTGTSPFAQVFSSNFAYLLALRNLKAAEAAQEEQGGRGIVSCGSTVNTGLGNPKSEKSDEMFPDPKRKSTAHRPSGPDTPTKTRCSIHEAGGPGRQGHPPSLDGWIDERNPRPGRRSTVFAGAAATAAATLAAGDPIVAAAAAPLTRELEILKRVPRLQGMDRHGFMLQHQVYAVTWIINYVDH